MKQSMISVFEIQTLMLVTDMQQQQLLGACEHSTKRWAKNATVGGHQDLHPNAERERDARIP